MKTVLQWLVITFTATNSFAQNHANETGPVVNPQPIDISGYSSSALGFGQRTARQTEGWCTLPPQLRNGRYTASRNRCRPEDMTPACQSIPGAYVFPDWVIYFKCDPAYKLNTTKTIAVCHKGRWLPRLPTCEEKADIDTIPAVPPPQVPVKTSPPVLIPKKCKLPTESPYTRFCLVTAGCENCDLNNTRCHIPSGTEVNAEVEVTIVCAPGYTTQSNDKAMCVSRGWYPSIPECTIEKADNDSIPTVPLPQVPSTTSPPVLLPKRCMIPVHSLGIRYCSTAPGCEDCDFKKERCHLPPCEEVEVGIKIKEVCESDPVAQISTATCQSRGWHPPFPKCQFRCGVSKGVNKSTPIAEEYQNANVGYFPWQASFFYLYTASKWQHMCEGTLITNRFVLSPFKCGHITTMGQVRIALGKRYDSFGEQEEYGVIRNISETFMQSYNFTLERSIDHKFDLVLLSEEVKLSEYIRPVCLYHGDDSSELLRNSILYVTKFEGVSFNTLAYRKVTLKSELECQKAIDTGINVKERFCISNTDTIHGWRSFGGGLIAVDEDGLHYLIGYELYKIENVKVYTNLIWGSYRDWIDSARLPLYRSITNER